MTATGNKRVIFEERRTLHGNQSNARPRSILRSRSPKRNTPIPTTKTRNPKPAKKTEKQQAVEDRKEILLTVEESLESLPNEIKSLLMDDTSALLKLRITIDDKLESSRKLKDETKDAPRSAKKKFTLTASAKTKELSLFKALEIRVNETVERHAKELKALIAEKEDLEVMSAKTTLQEEVITSAYRYTRLFTFAARATHPDEYLDTVEACAKKIMFEYITKYATKSLFEYLGADKTKLLKIMNDKFTDSPVVEIKIEGEPSQKRRATETPETQETPVDLTEDNYSQTGEEEHYAEYEDNNETMQEDEEFKTPDERIEELILTRLKTHLRQYTYLPYHEHLDRERTRKTESMLAGMIKAEKIETVTAATAEAVNKEPSLTAENMEAYITKQVEKMLAIKLKANNKSFQKNSTGGRHPQTSQPKKNEGKGKGEIKHSRGNSQKNSEKHSEKKPPRNSNQNSNQNPNKNPNQTKKTHQRSKSPGRGRGQGRGGRGGRGDAARGGRGKR